MFIRRFIILLTAAVIAMSAMAASDASFDLVPPRNVVEGRNFALTFRLQNAESSSFDGPELDGCTLLYGPAVSTMQSTQIVNGRLSSSTTVDYTFTYRADRAGTVVVPVLALRTNAGTLRTSEARFEILPPDRTQTTQGQQGGNQGGRVEAPQGGKISADDVLIRVFFSKNSVYEQEPVVATIKVYTKYDISAFLPTVQPSFEGFLTEELPVDNNVSIEHYNGQNYHTAVLKRLLLYPQRSGRLSVNSGKYNITVVQYETINMGFYRTSRPIEREITTTSNAAAITVRALPEPRPAGFSGAVGQFSVSTSLEPELMRTNEASVYSYKVRGTGNIKFLSPVEMEFPAGIETYTPRTNIDARLTAGCADMTGTFTTDFTIVPMEVGNFTIEGKPFVYFDPSAGQYRTAEVSDTPIRVLRGTGTAAPVQNSDVNTEINDILHIHPSDINRQSADVHYTFGTRLYWVIYIVLALILIGVVFLYRRQIRLNADAAGRRLAKAGRAAGKRLKAARTAMDAHQGDAFYAAISSALWGYLSDKLAIPASQLTRENISDKLSAYGLDAAQTQNILDVLDACEMARFTPAGSDSEMAEVYQKASGAISAVENVKK